MMKLGREISASSPVNMYRLNMDTSTFKFTTDYSRGWAWPYEAGISWDSNWSIKETITSSSMDSIEFEVPADIKFDLRFSLNVGGTPSTGSVNRGSVLILSDKLSDYSRPIGLFFSYTVNRPSASQLTRSISVGISDGYTNIDVQTLNLGTSALTSTAFKLLYDPLEGDHGSVSIYYDNSTSVTLLLKRLFTLNHGLEYFKKVRFETSNNSGGPGVSLSHYNTFNHHKFPDSTNINFLKYEKIRSKNLFFQGEKEYRRFLVESPKTIYYEFINNGNSGDYYLVLPFDMSYVFNQAANSVSYIALGKANPTGDVVLKYSYGGGAVGGNLIRGFNTVNASYTKTISEAPHNSKVKVKIVIVSEKNQSYNNYTTKVYVYVNGVHIENLTSGASPDYFYFSESNYLGSGLQYSGKGLAFNSSIFGNYKTNSKYSMLKIMNGIQEDDDAIVNNKVPCLYSYTQPVPFNDILKEIDQEYAFNFSVALKTKIDVSDHGAVYFESSESLTENLGFFRLYNSSGKLKLSLKTNYSFINEVEGDFPLNLGEYSNIVIVARQNPIPEYPTQGTIHVEVFINTVTDSNVRVINYEPSYDSYFEARRLYKYLGICADSRGYNMSENQANEFKIIEGIETDFNTIINTTDDSVIAELPTIYPPEYDYRRVPEVPNLVKSNNWPLNDYTIIMEIELESLFESGNIFEIGNLSDSTDRHGYSINIVQPSNSSSDVLRHIRLTSAREGVVGSEISAYFNAENNATTTKKILLYRGFDKFSLYINNQGFWHGYYNPVPYFMDPTETKISEFAKICSTLSKKASKFKVLSGSYTSFHLADKEMDSNKIIFDGLWTDI